MGKQIIDLIGELVEISGNSTVDGIIFFIVGLISFSVAFGLVGKIFDALGFYDSDLMSDVHWLIRVAVFGGLTYLCIKIVQFITWLLSFQWWVYVLAVTIVIAIIVLVHWIRYNYQLRKHTAIVSGEQQQTLDNNSKVVKNENFSIRDNKFKTANTYDKSHCPRCNSKLVKRHGPYGDFYGCEAYSRTGCRYTRKYL